MTQHPRVSSRVSSTQTKSIHPKEIPPRPPSNILTPIIILDHRGGNRHLWRRRRRHRARQPEARARRDVLGRVGTVVCVVGDVCRRDRDLSVLESALAMRAVRGAGVLRVDGYCYCDGAVWWVSTSLFG